MEICQERNKVGALRSKGSEKAGQCKKKIRLRSFRSRAEPGEIEKGRCRILKSEAFGGPCNHQKTAPPEGRYVAKKRPESRFFYFLLKKFIVIAVPTVANDRMASTKTLSRSGRAARSSSFHSPSTYST